MALSGFVGQNAISTNPVHKIVGKTKFRGRLPVILMSQVESVKISPPHFAAATWGYAKEWGSASFQKWLLVARERQGGGIG
jgi:hypothetical protein